MAPGARLSGGSVGLASGLAAEHVCVSGGRIWLR